MPASFEEDPTRIVDIILASLAIAVQPPNTTAHDHQDYLYRTCDTSDLVLVPMFHIPNRIAP